VIQCPYCKGEGRVNKKNKDGTLYYKCKSCKKNFRGQEETLSKDIELPGFHPDSQENRMCASGEWDGSEFGNMPPSLEDILDKFKVDRSVFEVEKYVVNEWPMGYKKADGTAASHILYQCKVWLARIAPIDFKIPAPPVISLVVRPDKKKPKVSLARVVKGVFACDFHIGYSRDMKTGSLVPYHDRQAIDIMMNIAKNDNVDVVVLGGDVVDMAEFTNKFPRTPDQFFTVRPALIEVKWLLTRMRLLLPNTDIIWIEGNHDLRLRRCLLDNQISAYDLMSHDEHWPLVSLPNALQLDEIDIEWIGEYPDNEYWLNENLRCVHGGLSRTKSGQTAYEHVRDSKCSTLFGHIHRQEMVADTSHHHSGPKEYQAACPGMMGFPARVPANTAKHNWQQGFFRVDVVSGNGPFSLRQIEIRNGNSLYGGVIVSGRDYVEELRADSGWTSFAE